MPQVGLSKFLATGSIQNYDDPMPAVTLKAHFNGKQIVLDEPFDLPPDSPLIVTVLSIAPSEDPHWHDVASHALAGAYGEDEPDYSDADLK
jgi:hypothetical protein